MFLLLSILSSTLIFITFKLFDRFGVSNFYAILTNYVVAGLLGYWLTEQHISFQELTDKPWFPLAIGMGFMFITLFQIMAKTAQRLGVVTVSVAVKMGAILPVIAGILLYSEPANFWIVSGVILGLLAVYFTTKKDKIGNTEANNLWILVLPIVLFFGDGMIGVLMKYAQHHWLEPSEMALFSGVVFAMAFCWGILFLVYELFQKSTPKIKDVVGGIALGIPNFGSIYFLMEALDKSGMTSAAIYPINNVAIVGLSAIIGFTVFKEHLSKINIIGLLCALTAILLITNG